MKGDQKLLLLGGAVLFIVSAIMISTASVPNDATSAIMFPLSILGLVFGIIFVVWGASWILLSRTKLLK